MQKKNGSALVQYTIILALSSIVVIGIYMAYGQQINTIFNNYLSIFTDNNSKVEANAKLLATGAATKMPPLTTEPSTPTSTSTTPSTTPGAPGPLGGTPNNPVSQCNSSSCDIDFGSFLLKGVPDNISDITKNSGVSGGVDDISDLIMQIAVQLEAQGDLAGAQEYRDLANLGHFIASGEKLFESNKNSKTIDEIDQSFISVPSNIKHILTSSLQLMHIYSNDTGGGTPGHARAMKISDPAEFDNYRDTYPSWAFVDIYDKIQENPKYPPELKNVTAALYAKANDLIGTSWLSHTGMYMQGLGSSSPTLLTTLNDPFTGLGDQKQYNMTEVINNPPMSGNQNINAVLICAAGNNTDINNTCNK